MTLVILAHPDFSRSVANKAVVGHLQNSGLDIEIRDLAALYPDYRIDSAAEQQALLRHRTIVFQYPLYWYNMPAILKQYFDCVLTYGFAYGTGGDKLKGKNFVPSITIGAPEQDYRADGEAHFEAARDKFPHFLRKTLWKFVALFATLLHFLQKRHFCRFLFYQLHMAISPLVLPVLLLPME